MTPGQWSLSLEFPMKTLGSRLKLHSSVTSCRTLPGGMMPACGYAESGFTVLRVGVSVLQPQHCFCWLFEAFLGGEILRQGISVLLDVQSKGCCPTTCSLSVTAPTAQLQCSLLTSSHNLCVGKSQELSRSSSSQC